MLNTFLAYLTVSFMNVTEREEGQGLVEYALILVLVSIATIGVLAALGVKIGNVFTQVTAAL